MTDLLLAGVWSPLTEAVLEVREATDLLAEISGDCIGIGGCPSVTGFETVTIAQAGSQGVNVGPFPGLADEIAERRQRRELPWGEQVRVELESVALYSEPECLVGQRSVRY
ncbi:hypothetical protein [Blastococcus capsensis]|uniref:hypothetical protein n=1 Tax=Blastococcus capsensis TaxID=1564163 RepID=UPI0025409E03|nr:hypothetical protein [Blastococcus capsensis]MDK3258351.1 hypothetical protein [Blastococcus capsensis]